MEHGHIDYMSLHAEAASLRDRAATFVRNALLSCLPIPPDLRANLEEPPFSVAVRTDIATKVLAGLLRGPTKRLAARGNLHPDVDWQSELISIEENKEHRYDIVYRDNIQLKVGTGVVLEQFHTEILGPVSRHSVSDIKITRAPDADVDPPDFS